MPFDLKAAMRAGWESAKRLLQDGLEPDEVLDQAARGWEAAQGVETTQEPPDGEL